jgi:hypothetical protein
MSTRFPTVISAAGLVAIASVSRGYAIDAPPMPWLMVL